MKKFVKALMICGTLAFVLGLLGIAGGIILSFSSLRMNESAGIGAIGGFWLQLALLGSLAAIVGVFLIVVGVILFLLSKRSENN
jgi:hypothetical protein